MIYEIKETEEVCANCRNFKQHYIKGGKYSIDDYIAVDHGRCIYPKMKYKRPGDSCRNFEARYYIEEEDI